MLGGGAVELVPRTAPPPEDARNAASLDTTLLAEPGAGGARNNPAAAAASRIEGQAAPGESVSRPSAAPAAVPEAQAAPTAAVPRTLEVRPGDTLLGLLSRNGIASDDAQSAIAALSAVWHPRDLRVGQKLAVFAQSDRLHSIRVAMAPGRDVVVARNDTGGFVAEDQERPIAWVPSIGTGTIRTSLSEAGNEAGVPIAVLSEMIRAFSYDVDFQREVRPGDAFTILYERIFDEYGHPAAAGQLVYAEMVLSGSHLRLYRFAPAGGEPGYYTAFGENIRKPLLRTPIDGARLTSGFGMRFHPILGYSRMHRGVDFGAPMGTPVFAAGDGVVVRAGPASGYGNYIEIEHNREYATAYGHLSGYAQGLRVGEHVRQGQVIGYVGMTGLATGPHLHYEVHYQGVQIDPLSVKMPALTRLAGKDMKAFEGVMHAIDRQLQELRPDLVARADCSGGRC